MKILFGLFFVVLFFDMAASALSYHPFSKNSGYELARTKDTRLAFDIKYFGEKTETPAEVQALMTFKMNEVCIENGFKFARDFMFDKIKNANALPAFQATFDCNNELWQLTDKPIITGTVEEANTPLIKSLTKDNYGGTVVITANPVGSFHQGDIIIKINNVRLMHLWESTNIISKLPEQNKSQILITVIRQGKIMDLPFRPKNTTADVQRDLDISKIKYCKILPEVQNKKICKK